ncbi:MAG: NAD(P)-dependent oxidoreductase [Bacteroidota bacterium]
MKVLVTGATGFLGRHIVGYLKSLDGIEIITSSIDELDLIKFPWIQNTKYIQANIYSTNTNWFEFFQQPDKLIHLAWKGLPNYKGLFHFTENLFYDFAFLENLIQQGLKDLTVTGTCFEYGLQEGCLSEEMQTMPDNPYAIAKDTLRKMLFQLQKNKSFHLKWVRLFYMYGEGQSPNSILSQLDKALENKEAVFNMSGGEQIRDYQPVEEMAKNIVVIALQNKITGIINNCSGKGIKIIDLVKNHLVKQNKEIQLNLGFYPYPDFEPFQFWGNNDKLVRIHKTYEKN